TEFTAEKSWLVIEYKEVWAEVVDSDGYEVYSVMGWRCLSLDLDRDDPPRLICIPIRSLQADGDQYIRKAA
ncbi:hypothetical protein HN588_03455, partial [Candidatus Bathyarchaeota archaeon]|nr:hypothetical protein [Candidatus Bathyarchaeota archaeon]